MMQGLIQRYLDWTNPIKGLAGRAIQSAFSDPQKVFAEWPQNSRQGFTVGLLEAADTIAAASNRVKANRDFLVEATLEAADCAVLLIERVDGDSIGLLFPGMELPIPGVSFELHNHLIELVSGDDQFREIFSNFGYTNLDQVSDAQIRSGCADIFGAASLKIEVFNSIRMYLDDCSQSSDEDWFIPFYHAMCVWAEHEYRKRIGLPPVLQGASPDIEAVGYSLFLNVVRRGEAQPFHVWKQLRSR